MTSMNKLNMIFQTLFCWKCIITERTKWPFTQMFWLSMFTETALAFKSRVTSITVVCNSLMNWFPVINQSRYIFENFITDIAMGPFAPVQWISVCFQTSSACCLKITNFARILNADTIPFVGAINNTEVHLSGYSVDYCRALVLVNFRNMSKELKKRPELTL